jgi:hypothetical protein
MKPTPPDDPQATGPESLSFTVHDTPAPMRDVPAGQSRRGRITMLLILLACALPVIASYFTYYVIRPQGRTNYATLVDPQRPLPDAATVPAQDLAGKPVALSSLKGQWLLVAVQPATCGPACEKTLFLQRQLREMMGAERDRLAKVWLVDSPGPLSGELAGVVEAKPPITALRVERAALARWLAPEAGHALEDHLYIVDPMGNWMMRTPADPDPVKLKKDVDRLLRASAWWNRPKDAR